MHKGGIRTLLQHKKFQTALAVCFWLLAWQAASAAVGNTLLLVSPAQVLRALGTLAVTGGFWGTVWFSAVRILGGFLLALAVGVLLAVCSARFGFVRVLLQPLMLTVKSVPVASFIILALLWLNGTGALAVLISFLMVLPVLYANTLAGIAVADAALLEMAQVFGVPELRRVRYLYLPAVLPPLRAGCAVGLGLCWKSGVAAEVIGITAGSIGEALYQAKIFFSTAELFAWTLVIILISLLFEKLFLYGFDALARGLTGTLPGRTHHGTLPPVQRGTALAAQGGIRLCGVSKRFGAQTVLRAVSACFAPGETVCIMAPSGAGKTTLLRILLGLLPPDAGTVQPKAARGEKRRRVFSCAFQEDRLVPQLTAEENVRFACADIAPVQIKQAFAAVGLHEQDTEKPAAQLSGGQQRRVALVRAMLAPAEAVLLDEPFKGLDDAARANAVQLIRQCQQGRTLLVVTHDAADAAALQARIWQLPGAEPHTP